jgi:hypothetical protein
VPPLLRCPTPMSVCGAHPCWPPRVADVAMVMGWGGVVPWARLPRGCCGDAARQIGSAAYFMSTRSPQLGVGGGSSRAVGSFSPLLMRRRPATVRGSLLAAPCSSPADKQADR